jgi:hypothetical protein
VGWFGVCEEADIYFYSYIAWESISAWNTVSEACSQDHSSKQFGGVEFRS